MTTPDTDEYGERVTWPTRLDYWAVIDGVCRDTSASERAAGLGSAIMPLLHNRPLLELLDDALAAERDSYWDHYSNHMCKWCRDRRQPCNCDDFPVGDAARWRPGDPVLASAPSTPERPCGPLPLPGWQLPALRGTDWERLYAHLEED
jgi:hypothetical protein